VQKYNSKSSKAGGLYELIMISQNFFELFIIFPLSGTFSSVGGPGWI
jgi:hypothetical protein